MPPHSTNIHAGRTIRPTLIEALTHTSVTPSNIRHTQELLSTSMPMALLKGFALHAQARLAACRLHFCY